MRILALTDSLAPWHSFRIRFGQYIAKLPWTVMVSDAPSALEQLRAGDVLFFYRFLSDWGCLQNALLRLKQRGVAIVTDLDDCVWQAPLGWDRQRQRLYTRAVRMADVITCSTPELQCLAQQMFPGQTTHLIRNSAPAQPPSTPKTSTQPGVIHLCWTGCPWTRPEDLALLQPLVQWIQAEQLPVTWRHIGHAEGRLSFAEAVGADPHSVETISIGSHEHFLNALDGDIGLAPVASKCFNTYKSEIKLLEFGSRSMAWIASDTRAYRELCQRWRVNGRLCKSGDDWIGHFQALLDLSQRRQEQRAWQRLTSTHQNHQQAAEQWVSLLQRVQAGTLRR